MCFLEKRELASHYLYKQKERIRYFKAKFLTSETTILENIQNQPREKEKISNSNHKSFFPILWQTFQLAKWPIEENMMDYI